MYHAEAHIKEYEYGNCHHQGLMKWCYRINKNGITAKPM